MRLRVGLIYLLCISATIALIYGVVQRGNRLQAPAVLPTAWHLRLAAVSGDCPLFPKSEFDALLSQSGEMLSFTLQTPWEIGLHGKVELSGNFQAEGKPRRVSLPDCFGEMLLWRGRIGRESIQGEFNLEPGSCARCRGGVQVSGIPKSR